MEPEYLQKVEQLYHAALEVEQSRRASFIDNACAGDESLKQEVESLLAHDRVESFMRAPAMEVAAQALAESRLALAAQSASPAESTIGRYRVVRLLGEGGMGMVFEAEQDHPRRVVALKVIKPGFATVETLRRFQHESDALGRLQHPGIAQIYEAGTADSGHGLQPYFAMELIHGCALHEYAETHRLNARDRLALMAKICDAVDHAHQRGVVHRDLKPGNILVDDTGQPKILDFGVARVTESDTQRTRQTGLGQLIGTLAYMSPEQVSGDPLALDSRSDVYALGVILYELLAGKLPYNIDRKPLPEAVGIIREEEPAALSSIQGSYRGDIDTVVAKALEKDKTRRYASAADLAADIRRYLADQPITARPASAAYQLRKFARRHKALVAGTAAVFVVLAAGVVVSTWEAVRARNAERAAKAQEETAQAVNNFLRNDLLAQASADIQSGPNTKPDPDLKVRTALDRAAAGITGKFDRQPEVEASIRETIGGTYEDLGLYAEATKQLERALEMYRRVLGADNPKTLKIVSRLGRTAYLQTKFAQAEALLSQALAAQRRVLGPEHPDTLYSMFNLGAVYESLGRYAQADALLTQTLEISRRVLGPEHLTTLAAMNSLAIDYGWEGKSAQAERLLLQTMEIERRVLGAEHPNTLLTTNNLATQYLQNSDFVQAEPIFRQVLEAQTRVLGSEHHDTLMTMINLATVDQALGMFAKSETLFAKTLEIQRRVLGPEHRLTIQCGINLSAVYEQLGKHAQAEALQSQTLSRAIHALGPEHPDTLLSMDDLADIFTSEGRYAEAEPLFTRTLEIGRRKLGPQSSTTLSFLTDFAAMYQRQGKYALAETYAAQALAGKRHAAGSQNPDTMSSAEDLALAYLSQGKFAESEPLAREALEFYQKNQPDVWQRFRADSLLGASLAGQKKFAQGRPLLREGYQGMLARKDRIAFPDRYHLDRAREWLK